MKASLLLTCIIGPWTACICVYYNFSYSYLLHRGMWIPLILQKLSCHVARCILSEVSMRGNTACGLIAVQLSTSCTGGGSLRHTGRHRLTSTGHLRSCLWLLSWHDPLWCAAWNVRCAISADWVWCWTESDRSWPVTFRGITSEQSPKVGVPRETFLLVLNAADRHTRSVYTTTRHFC